MAKKSARGSSRKTKAEMKVERMTWFLLVLVFALTSIARDNLGLTTDVLPNWLIPGAGAIILLGSGMYQYGKHWRVSPLTWIIGAVLLIFALLNLLIDPTLDLTGLSLLAFAIVILMGLMTGET